jgi:pSer/pThr/pTyr-binding forkhead associated (FHA) protein
MRTAAASPATIELVWKTQSLPLTEGEHVAGRDSEGALVVDGTTVSRRHARITVVSGAATIEDLDSTNGTHVNKAPISAPTRLAPGDDVALGSEVLTVRRRNPSALTVKVDSDKAAGERMRNK